MPGRNIATFGIYVDQISAGEAADSLKRIGFRSTDIAILLPHNVGSKDFGHEKHTKAHEVAAAGATVGALIGLALGWLVGISTFGIIPWLAPFMGAEPIGTVLSGIGAGSVLGLVIGAVIGCAIPTYEARRYEGRIRNGGILLSAHCDNKDWTKRAEDVLRQTGAKGIGTRAEARADFGACGKPLPRTRTTGMLDHIRPSDDATGPIPEDLESREKTSRDEGGQRDRRFSPELQPRL